jgi:hypothetical protein
MLLGRRFGNSRLFIADAAENVTRCGYVAHLSTPTPLPPPLDYPPSFRPARCSRRHQAPPPRGQRGPALGRPQPWGRRLDVQPRHPPASRTRGEARSTARPQRHPHLRHRHCLQPTARPLDCSTACGCRCQRASHCAGHSGRGRPSGSRHARRHGPWGTRGAADGACIMFSLYLGLIP